MSDIDTNSPERIVQAVLYPWVEEVQGEKFAAHDALRQAEQVVTALRDAGYMRPAPPSADDVMLDAIEDLRTRIDGADSGQTRNRLGIEMFGLLKKMLSNQEQDPELTTYLSQQARFVLIEIFQFDPEIIDDAVARMTEEHDAERT